MGLGFKYHVVTIAAIFFALTIGLVVGSLFGSPRVPQTTVIAIEALKRSQAALEKNTSDLKQERDALQTSLRQTLPYALKGRLSGLSLALVQTSSDASNLTEDVRAVLTQSGARVASVTLLERPFNQPDELLLPRLASQQEADSRFPTNRGELIARLVTALQANNSSARTPSDNSANDPDVRSNSSSHEPPSSNPMMGNNAENGTFIGQLQEAGFIRTDPDNRYDLPVRAVVLLTGSRNEASNLAQNVDVPLVTALQKAGLAVFACEAQDVVSSSFPAYRAVNVPATTIDRIDTDPGRWQLVTALANTTL